MALLEQMFDSKTRRGKPPDPQERDSASLHDAPILRSKASSRQSRPQCLLARPVLYIHYRIKIFLQYYGMLSVEMSVFTPYIGDLSHILYIVPFAFVF